MPQFCRHNRFISDCPICSKGTVLEGGRAEGGRTRARSAPARSTAGPTPGSTYKGTYAAAGPYEDGAYEVRLERVPGGLRMAEWQAGQIRRRAPVLDASDLPGLLSAALERGVEGADELAGAVASGEPSAGDGGAGVSPGRAGELREELRVEPLEEGRLRVGRWVLRPGSGWQLQEAPVMLPAARYAEALGQAARLGLLTS